MKHFWSLGVRLAVACLPAMVASDALARNGSAVVAPRCSSGNYGSVRQSNHQSGAAVRSSRVAVQNPSRPVAVSQPFGNESYGSVRQVAYQAPAATAVSGSSTATVGDGQAEYSREVTGPGGQTASKSGSATVEDGQGSYNRQVTGSDGQTATVSGSGSRGDGQVQGSREATGPNGGTVSSQRTVSSGAGRVSAQHTVVATGEAGAVGAVRVGSTVTVLPAGHSTVTVRGTSYYYHGGHYYQAVSVGGVRHYTVIRPPAGVVVDELPGPATVIVIEDNVYYIFEGVYYRREFVNGQVAYVVVVAPK